MQNSIRTIVEVIGSIAPSKERASYITSSLGKTTDLRILADDILIQLRRHRILQITNSNLKYLRGIHPLYELLLALLAPIIEEKFGAGRKDYLELSRLVQCDKFMLIKGAAVASLYPPTMVRDYRDVDVFVPHFDAMWYLLNALSNRYGMGKMKLYMYSASEVSGSIDLSPEDTDSLPYIDLHMGYYHIWGATKYGGDLWARRQRLQDSFSTPSWEDCLLLIAAHTATEWYYRHRDINDIFVILTRVENLDWDYIISTAERDGLLGILSLLMMEMSRIYSFELPADFAKPNWRCRQFVRKNWGKAHKAFALLQQSEYLLQRYPAHFGTLRSIVECCRNAKNMVLYDNRAYNASRRRRIRAVRPNEVLVLVNLKNNARKFHADIRLGDPIWSSSFRVINRGRWEEYFLSPVGVWIQSNYQGYLSSKEVDRMENYIRLELSGKN